jgi:hypothetical protein
LIAWLSRQIASAGISITASIARPFSSGAVMLIVRVSSSPPTILSRYEPGTTLTLRRAEGSGAFVTVPAIPKEFAFEGHSKSDSQFDSLFARRTPQEVAPRYWHPPSKHKPQKDLRHPAASCGILRKEPKLPE